VDPAQRNRGIVRVLWEILALNWGVAITKLVVGLISHSGSMVADGFHSFADGASNVIGLIAMRISRRSIDKDHPYGHGKYETLATLVIGTMLFSVTFGVLRSAWERFREPVTPEVSPLSFVVMFSTIAVNVFVIWYERRAGVRLRSDILISDSYHTRSDLYVSFAVLVSLAGAKLGYPQVDTFASVIIAGFIAKAGYDVLKVALHVLVDGARLDGEIIAGIALEVTGVQGCHQVRSRGRDDEMRVDLHIQVARSMTVDDAHEVQHEVARRIREKFNTVQDVVVHVEPAEEIVAYGKDIV
jgi:cation diffusion facilitator family transporter